MDVWRTPCWDSQPLQNGRRSCGRSGLTKHERVEEGAMLETEGRVQESFLYRSLLPFACLLFPRLTSRAAACRSAGVVGMVA